MANPKGGPIKFRKGQSGNPGGRPRNLITKRDIEVTFQKFATMNAEQIEAVIDDPTSSNLDASVASLWKLARKANVNALDFILNRAVGKVTDVSEQHIHDHKEILEQIPTEQLLKLVEK